MRWPWTLAGLLAFGIGVSFAQAPETGKEGHPEPGHDVYDKLCSQCHGDAGDGQGVARNFFKPEPRDFTKGLFKIRTTASGQLPTHEDLKSIVQKGMPYTGMPAWPHLSGEELEEVVRYVESFSSDFADAELRPEPIKIPKAPGFSKESAELGIKIFEENRCADCHGVLGRTDGKSASTLTDEWGNTIRPADLTKRWTFRGGSTREDIYRTFTTGLNGTPMPSYADLIGEEDRWHLVDYVYSLSRDEPDYSSLVTAVGVEGTLDLATADEHFATAPMAFFPVLGQIVEPGRNFQPTATGIEVRAIYDAEKVLVRLSWNDMTAERAGENGPAIAVPESDSAAASMGVLAGPFSDAVAVQTPAAVLAGAAKPYFLWGDAKYPVDIWFADLAKPDGALLAGRGSQSIEPQGESIPITATYEAGEWRVTFQRPRHPEHGPVFDEGVFVPVAFSLWDGYNQERGNRRSVTSWYHVYVKPLKAPARTLPAAGYGFLILLVEFAIVHVARRKYHVPAPRWLTPHVPEGIDLGFSLLGGLVATMAMTVFLYFVMPTLFHSPMNMTDLIHEMFSGLWFLGVTTHFVLGALVFPLIFVEFFYEKVPGPAWIRGLAWGALLWFVAELVAIPIANGGFFHAHAGGMRAAFGFLIGHLIYGAVLGAVTGSSGPDPKDLEYPVRSEHPGRT